MPKSAPMMEGMFGDFTPMGKIVVIAAAVLAMAGPAAAMGGRNRNASGQSEPNKAAAAKKAKEAERAYQEALKKIPDKKQDPWGSLR